MNRFSKSSQIRYRFQAFIFPIALFLIFIGLFLLGISGVSKTSDRESYQNLRTALERSVVHCYAIEGRYPPSLDYLKSHYGITYDENKYFIDYQPIASNMMPDITIISLEADE